MDRKLGRRWAMMMGGLLDSWSDSSLDSWSDSSLDSSLDTWLVFRLDWQWVGILVFV
jgi:hypothetical protein